MGRGLRARRSRTAGRWLLLSGTPFRSRRQRRSRACATTRTASPCPTSPTPTPTRCATAICRPVTFVPYDGVAAVAQRRGRRRGVVRRRARRARGGAPLPHGDLDRAARRPAADPRAPRTSAWRACAPAATATPAGSSSPPTASTRARSPSVLREVTGTAPIVVLHTEARAAEKLARVHARRASRWIVAVNMVSEGVDIPRLRVGVYATAAKTPLIFRQIVGRFVRTIPGRPVEPSWLYLPGRPGAARATRPTSRASCATSCAARGEDDPGALDEPRERARDRARRAPSFVPVAADVAPQLALFGAPAAARRAGRAPSPPRRRRPCRPTERELPAFERRALLRDKRHRLVADLRRRDGAQPRARSTRWLNRASGVAARRATRRSSSSSARSSCCSPS